jgi:hypothetical protein
MRDDRQFFHSPSKLRLDQSRRRTLNVHTCSLERLAMDSIQRKMIQVQVSLEFCVMNCIEWVISYLIICFKE